MNDLLLYRDVPASYTRGRVTFYDPPQQESPLYAEIGRLMTYFHLMAAMARAPQTVADAARPSARAREGGCTGWWRCLRDEDGA
jgi:hypothetical protein